MATSENLTRYYDCLKDSFNKFQDKDSKERLVSAALRPKIRDEFSKSKDVLTSYLGYIRVFTLIYSDKFTNICTSIICPIFRESASSRFNALGNDGNQPDGMADQIHATMKEIFKSKPELAEEYAVCMTKLFPTVFDDDVKIFPTYLSNCLEIFTYVRGKPLAILVAKVLDRISPPAPKSETKEDNLEKISRVRAIVDKSYDLIYDCFDKLDKEQLENVAAAILAAFTREFLTYDNREQLNYLLLYLCSQDTKLTDLFVNILWATFINVDRPVSERRASILFVSSFMARASFVDLDQVFNHLDRAETYCRNMLNEISEERNPEGSNETIEIFHSLVQSMIYLITQRYREMYEEESIERLTKLNLDTIINSSLKPLEACNAEIVQRFREVATLYAINIKLDTTTRITSERKRRKSALESSCRHQWRAPYKENCEFLPERVKSLYLSYYDHRNFTVFRE